MKKDRTSARSVGAFFFRLTAAAKRLQSVAEDELARRGFTLNELRVLTVLVQWQESQLALPIQQEISEAAVLNKATVTMTMNSLQSKGFIRRHPDQADRRKYRIELTAAGRRAADDLTAGVLGAEKKRLGFTEAERRELEKLMAKALRSGTREPEV